MKKPSKTSSNGVSGTAKSNSTGDAKSVNDQAITAHSNTIAVSDASASGGVASGDVASGDVASGGVASGGVASGDAQTQIESRLVTRVLVLTSPHSDSVPVDATRTHAGWSTALVQAGHRVSWTERDAWKPEAVEHGSDQAPEVILFETRNEAEVEAVGVLCSQIKSSAAAYCTALLVALPNETEAGAPIKTVMGKKSALQDGGGAFSETLRAVVVARLQEAGADDFLVGAGDAELLARVGVLTRLSRVRAELEATREHLRLQMQMDDLTRLVNRRFFFQAAHREYSRARRYNHDLSCLMLDVNGFKQVNAAFGFECGDALLRQVANVLRDCTRDCDILARWAEDKFVILLPETPLEGAITLRENIMREVGAHKLKWHAHDLPLSVSIGEAARRLTRAAQVQAGEHAFEFGADFIESDQPEVVSVSLREEMAGLLEEADAALYVAKRGVRYQALPGAPANQITPAST